MKILGNVVRVRDHFDISNKSLHRIREEAEIIKVTSSKSDR